MWNNAVHKPSPFFDDNELMSTLPGKPCLLIVDDDPLIAETLALALASDFDILLSHGRSHCLDLLRRCHRLPDLALVDLGLPPFPHRPDEGFALIREMATQFKSIKVVVLSGQSDADNARHARTLGAIDFVAKPSPPDRLRPVLYRALDYRKLDAPPREDALIGNSPALLKLRTQLQQYADAPYPVLIEGESGCGKEIVARHGLHYATARRDKPFLALNCAAIAPNLVEATLFGHVKGAFTGAENARPGYFEDAADGTLFLDEIGELPLELQAKLLRVLENGEYQRIGETQHRLSRARIVAATNRDLRKALRLGLFRSDLYHRLSVFTLTVPPLREMDEDKFLLLDHFRHLYASTAGHLPFTFDPLATALWRRYNFPGNVRELRNIVIRLTARYPGQTVDVATLAGELDLDDPPETLPSPAPSTTPTPVVEAACQRLSQNEPFSLDRLLADTERGYIEAALRLTHGNVSQAARLLGINRTTLYHRMDSSLKEA